MPRLCPLQSISKIHHTISEQRRRSKDYSARSVLCMLVQSASALLEPHSTDADGLPPSEVQSTFVVFRLRLILLQLLSSADLDQPFRRRVAQVIEGTWQRI